MIQQASRPERRTFGFLLLLSLTHGVVDLSGGAVVALLPTLREQFALSYTMIGTIMLFSSLTSSVTQPIFGWISDRSERRWLLPASLLFGGVGLALTGFMPTYGLLLLFIVLNSLGTAAFHPEGAHAAYHLAGGRRARAMAIYSVGGNLGFALGPIYARLLLGLGEGARGTAWALVLPGLLALWLFRLLPIWQRLEVESSPTRAVRPEELPPNNWRGAVVLTLLVIIRSVINMGVVAFIPFFWIDVLGQPESRAWLVQMLYLIAGVGGTLIGSPLADRFGTRKMLIASFAILLPLQAALPHLRGGLLLAGLFAAGFVVVSTFAVTLVMTQQYMPRNLGLASGVNLGLAFGMGGVGALLLGMISDRWGVVTGLEVVAALVVPALLLAIALPPAERPAPRSTAAAHN